MLAAIIGAYYGYKDRKKTPTNYYFGGKKMSPVSHFLLKFHGTIIICFKSLLQNSLFTFTKAAKELIKVNLNIVSVLKL